VLPDVLHQVGELPDREVEQEDAGWHAATRPLAAVLARRYQLNDWGSMGRLGH
jgi:hypothetical protein